jgi:hypothetical protein
MEPCEEYYLMVEEGDNRVLVKKNKNKFNNFHFLSSIFTKVYLNFSGTSGALQGRIPEGCCHLSSRRLLPMLTGTEGQHRSTGRQVHQGVRCRNRLVLFVYYKSLVACLE